MQAQNQLIEIQSIQKDQKDNLLSQNQIQVLQSIQQKQTLPDPDTSQPNNDDSKQNQLIDPIEQLLKKNNIMPLLVVIDEIDLNRKIQQKPLLCIMATKFIPLNSILKDRQITFPLDQDRRSPLHYAIQANDLKAAAWLIQKGNPNQQDNFGNTPILDAIRLGRRRGFLLCMKNKMYDERAPIFAAMYNRHWELKVLHGMKMDIFKYRDQQNKSSFERALQYCSFDCAQFMIKIKPDLPIQKNQNVTESAGLIRRLKRILYQQSSFYKTKQLVYPFTLMTLIFIGLNINTLFGSINQSFPYDQTKTFYSILLILIASLYGMMFFFGSLCKSKVEYSQKHSLSQILMEPTYQTLQQICPVCVHFTDYRYDHCYSCGMCVEKYHFHTFTCVNKSNQVFWILSEAIWLYLSCAILHQFNQHLAWNHLSISSVSSFKLLRFVASLEYLYSQHKYLSIVWVCFLIFVFLNQFFYFVSILGMMFMRRKYPEVINSEKYIHLFELMKFQDNFLNRQKRIFKRGLCSGFARCVRNAFVYFFVDN